MNFIKKMSTIFTKIVLGTVSSGLIMLIGLSKEDGGLGLNSFLCFILWIAMMFVLIKISAILCFAISTGLFLVFGILVSESPETLLGIVGLLVGVAVLGIVIDRYNNWRDERDAKIRELHQQGKNCCPHCASPRIHYIQGHTEHSSHIEWNYDYSDSRYHRDSVIDSRHHEGYWECLACGRTFRKI